MLVVQEKIGNLQGMWKFPTGTINQVYIYKYFFLFCIMLSNYLLILLKKLNTSTHKIILLKFYLLSLQGENIGDAAVKEETRISTFYYYNQLHIFKIS